MYRILSEGNLLYSDKHGYAFVHSYCCNENESIKSIKRLRLEEVDERPLVLATRSGQPAWFIRVGKDGTLEDSDGTFWEEKVDYDYVR